MLRCSLFNPKRSWPLSIHHQHLLWIIRSWVLSRSLKLSSKFSAIAKETEFKQVQCCVGGSSSASGLPGIDLSGTPSASFWTCAASNYKVVALRGYQQACGSVSTQRCLCYWSQCWHVPGRASCIEFRSQLPGRQKCWNLQDRCIHVPMHRNPTNWCCMQESCNSACRILERHR